jgi:hypothetical protein
MSIPTKRASHRFDLGLSRARNRGQRKLDPHCAVSDDLESFSGDNLG